MLLFGLTGGLGAGKSTVAARFASRGVPVIDADQVAREVVLPGTPALADIAQEFGPGVIAPDGALDRKALARLVFEDPAKRRRLNALTHPRIAQRTAERAAALATRGEPLACYEAALLVENGLADAFRPLVVVVCDPAVRIARAARRDGDTEEAARARVVAQADPAEQVKLADLVIRNDGGLDALERAADEALAKICAGANVPPSRYGLPG